MVQLRAYFLRGTTQPVPITENNTWKPVQTNKFSLFLFGGGFRHQVVYRKHLPSYTFLQWLSWDFGWAYLKLAVANARLPGLNSMGCKSCIPFSLKKY